MKDQSERTKKKNNQKLNSFFFFNVVPFKLHLSFFSEINFLETQSGMVLGIGQIKQNNKIVSFLKGFLFHFRFSIESLKWNQKLDLLLPRLIAKGGPQHQYLPDQTFEQKILH